MNRWLIIMVSIILFSISCNPPEKAIPFETVQGRQLVSPDLSWLSHEHLLVDFIGADSIQPEAWNHDSIIEILMPYLEDLRAKGVSVFVDATPNYLGRDPILLRKLSEASGLHILTNTGYYGARNNKFIPAAFFNESPEEWAVRWIEEFQQGIGTSGAKPAFIKIGVDATDPLDTLHQKLVSAAAITHLETGLTIASHTGPAVGLWPQLEILRNKGVDPSAVIWVHAQAESDNQAYLKAAAMNCWISLDGMGYEGELEKHLEKLAFAKENGILDHILIAHDAGWFDPQKKEQSITPFTNIHDIIIPRLKEMGFTSEELQLLLSTNPRSAYECRVRALN